MRGRQVFAAVPGACGVCLALLLSGCGGGTRQDASEPKGTFAVKIVKASFPARQSVAREVRMVLQVHNAGTQTVPNVAVSIDSFAYTSHYPNLASNKRPIWVLETGPGAIPPRPVESEAVSPPGGGQTAYVNTWALGPLAPGHTGAFVWHVMPVKAGRYTVHYTVAAGLSGRARAQLLHGGPAIGHLTATIAPRPPATHVDPETGDVVPGAYPPAP
ncbi:MAG: hypothetical protein ACRDK7_08965 [Solirubrobacteraceae bacterium]